LRPGTAIQCPGRLAIVEPPLLGLVPCGLCIGPLLESALGPFGLGVTPARLARREGLLSEGDREGALVVRGREACPYYGGGRRLVTPCAAAAAAAPASRGAGLAN